MNENFKPGPSRKRLVNEMSMKSKSEINIRYEQSR